MVFHAKSGHMVTRRAFCGLDFGTSNSALSLGYDLASLRLTPLENDNVTIPSAIFFNTEENRIVFGREGLAEYRAGYEGRLLRALKSILGSELIHEATQIGKRKISFQDIIGFFIAHVKEQAEKTIDHPIERIVLGRPVHFVDDDRIADQRAEDELRSIAAAQGFNEIHFEYEPIAAARDYESIITKEEIVLVFDIGGGTSDFSVIRLAPERRKAKNRSADILGNHGIHIGGTNFDQKLSLETVMKDLGYQSLLKNGLEMPKSDYLDFSTWYLINMLYAQKRIAGIKSLLPRAVERELLERFLVVLDQQRGHELAELVELAKIELSTSREVFIDASAIIPGWIRQVTANNLQTAIDAEVDKIILGAIDTVKAAAQIDITDVNTIFLTGGSTGLPGFAQKIQAVFPNAELRYGDRFSSVAKGLGIAAAKLFF